MNENFVKRLPKKIRKSWARDQTAEGTEDGFKSATCWPQGVKSKPQHPVFTPVNAVTSGGCGVPRAAHSSLAACSGHDLQVGPAGQCIAEGLVWCFPV